MTMTPEDLMEIALESTRMTREEWDALASDMRSDARMNQIMKRDWNAQPRDSEEAIREYYRTSKAWFVNTFNHGYGALLAMAAKAGATLQPWGNPFLKHLPYGTPEERRVLDYGGGFFKDSWPLAEVLCHVTVAEIRGPVTRFLKSFIHIAGLEHKYSVLEVDSATPLTSLYQGIICFETLEHLLHPEALTEHLFHHLTSGGPFAFSVTFPMPFSAKTRAVFKTVCICSSVSAKSPCIPRAAS